MVANTYNTWVLKNGAKDKELETSLGWNSETLWETKKGVGMKKGKREEEVKFCEVYTQTHTHTQMYLYHHNTNDWSINSKINNRINIQVYIHFIWNSLQIKT